MPAPPRAVEDNGEMAEKRMGTESSATRALLLDVTERLMLKKGYAAVSSRSVAKDAGVTAALVHYYFRTLDDLFLAAFRREAEKQLVKHDRLLREDQPLRALWDFSNDPSISALLFEFMALANHRKSIRSEIAQYSERFRRVQIDALSAHLEAHGLGREDLPPEAIIVSLIGVSRTLAMEQSLGVSGGHPETLALVERYLTRLEGPRPAAPRST
jgi:AcrR family transcriptional regulator